MAFTLQDIATITGTDIQYILRDKSTGRGQVVCCSLSRTEIAKKGILSSIMGTGKNSKAAEKNYLKKIKGQKIVVDAFMKTRREFDIP